MHVCLWPDLVHFLSMLICLRLQSFYFNLLYCFLVVKQRVFRNSLIKKTNSQKIKSEEKIFRPVATTCYTPAAPTLTCCMRFSSRHKPSHGIFALHLNWQCTGPWAAAGSAQVPMQHWACMQWHKHHSKEGTCTKTPFCQHRQESIRPSQGECLCDGGQNE